MVKKKNVISIILTTLVVLSLFPSNISEEPLVLDNSESEIIELNNLSELPLESSIDQNDRLTGLGDNLICDEDAQYTNTSQSIISLDNNSHDYAYIETPPKWTGYELFTEISSLSDNTTWEMNGKVDSASNWTYDEIDYEDYDDTGDTPDENCFGYYQNSSESPLGTETGTLFVGIRYYDPPDDPLDTSEYAAFNQTINLDRGSVSYCRLDFSHYNEGTDFGIATGFIDINGYKVNFDAFGSTGWKNERIVIPTSELPYMFNGVDNVTIKLGIDVILTAVLTSGDLPQALNFDNITLWIRAEANPTQLDLKVNGTSIADNEYGSGSASLSGNWPNPSTSATKTVIANFTTNSTDVNFETDLTLYVNKTKNTQDSVGDPYSEFFIDSGQEVNWTTYFYGAKPALYEDYNFTMYFPSDWTVWSAIDPNPIEVINYLTENPSSLEVPSERANNYPGTWKIRMNSPNYVEGIDTYKNTTEPPGPTDWIATSEIYPGDYLNVTGTIKHIGGLIPNLIDTKATLTIKFPNGTIWADQTQIKTVSSNSNGLVFFDAIQIPSSGPNYIAGEYKIFVSWNNSYSSYGINETGMLMETITVKHLSKITMDKLYYADLIEDTTVGVTVQYNDLLNNDPIRNAQLYFVNLTGQTQYMTEIAPGYYFAEIYGDPVYQGENTIKIYANSTKYQNLTQDITVEVVLKTTIDATEYPTLTTPWNKNATVHISFEETITADPILNANFTIDWSGEYWINEIGSGSYELHLNTSSYIPNNIYELNISNFDIGFDPAELLIDIKINPRSSKYNLYLNEYNKTDTKLIELPIYNTLNISIEYLDILNKSLIPTDSVILKDFGLGDISLDLSNDIYQNEINTNDLGVGIHELTINATSEFNYPIILPFTVIVTNRTTDYQLFLNDTDKTLTKSYELPIFTSLNVSMKYFDQNGSVVNGANVALSGSGSFNELLTFDNGLYESTFDISAFGVGIHEINLTAWVDKYDPISFVITITITNRETDYGFELNKTDSKITESIEVTIFAYVNISVDFHDLNGTFLLDADVILQDFGAGNIALVESNGFYQTNLATTLLGGGIHQLTIIANKTNYEQITIVFTINILKETSNYTLLLNTYDRTSTGTYEITIFESLNISLNYFDNATKMLIDPATVILQGVGTTDQPLTIDLQSGLYYFDLNSLSLGGGIHSLKIIATSTNHKQIVVNIILTINQRDSGISLFVDSEDLTLINSLEAPIRSILNISIDYYDYISKVTISTGSCNLTGGDLGNIELNYQNGIFQVQLNTSDLGLGVYFLTIDGDHVNYAFNSTTLTITVVQISTTIRTKDMKNIITVEPGKSFIIGVYLDDNISNTLIFGANVSYSSIFGNGYLIDEDNDGYYTIEISGLEIGLYVVYISVDKGEDYAFQDFEITINVVQPEQTGGLTPAAVASMSGAIILVIGAMMSYLLYFKYPKRIREVRKLKKNLKKQETVSTNLKSQEDLYIAGATAEIIKVYPKYKQIKNQRLAELKNISENRALSDEIKPKIKENQMNTEEKIEKEIKIEKKSKISDKKDNIKEKKEVKKENERSSNRNSKDTSKPKDEIKDGGKKNE